MLLRIQLENIGLFPTTLKAFHNVLPMEQECIYGIYFYGISKQPSPASSVLLWWANTSRFKGEDQKKIKLKYQNLKGLKAGADSLALLWHELFMIKMTFDSHINSNGEGDILP